MVYQEVIVDALVLQHFNRINHLAKLHHQHGAMWENPQITQCWREKIGHHDFLYWVHVKTGYMGNHHNFTLVFETRKGQQKLLDMHEGHKSFF